MVGPVLHLRGGSPQPRVFVHRPARWVSRKLGSWSEPTIRVLDVGALDPCVCGRSLPMFDELAIVVEREIRR